MQVHSWWLRCPKSVAWADQQLSSPSCPVLTPHDSKPKLDLDLGRNTPLRGYNSVMASVR